MIERHDCSVIALDHYNPLGVIRSLGEHGISPIYIAVKHRVELGTKSKYLSQCFKAATVEDGYNILIKNFGNERKDNLPFLITCDDRTTAFLDEKYDELKNRFIFFNAGKKGRIKEYMNKSSILELAKRHGLKVLETRVVSHGEIPDDLSYPVITKSISPIIGGWKSDVHICQSAEELKAAYDEIEAPTVLIQKYIEKKNEYCLDGYCVNRGRRMFHAIVSEYNYLIPGYYSPYMTVSSLENEEIKKSIESMMTEIGFEGIYEIEFLIDKEDNYYFLEINFRNSTWSYAATKAGMPLPILWAESMLTGVINEENYKKIPEGFTAMVEPIDYSKRVETGKTDLADWLIDFKEANCGFYCSKEDPKPFKQAICHWKELG